MPSITSMTRAYKALEAYDRAGHREKEADRSEVIFGLLLDLRARDRVKDRAAALKKKKKRAA